MTVSPPLGSLSWRALFSRLGLESGVSKGDGGYFEIPLLILGFLPSPSSSSTLGRIRAFLPYVDLRPVRRPIQSNDT